MIARGVAWSARHPRLVLALAALLAIGGELGRRGLTTDVLPDLSDPQVAIVAEWMGHSATEVAASVTGVLTAELAALPGAASVRGASMAGMAYVDVVFASAGAVPSGREAILARVAAARSRLPATARVQVGPAASSTGWVFQYLLVDPTHGTPPRALRRLQEDRLHPALASIPGVVEVASVGGATDELLVEVLEDNAEPRRVAFSDVADAVRAAVAARGATTPAEIEALPIAGVAATPGAVRVGDVARVRVVDAMPSGLADFQGELAAVGGIVIAGRGADLAAVGTEVRRRLEQERPRLPPGVRLVTAYDRLDLVSRIGHTLGAALAEEIGVVVLVVLLSLLHARSALVPLGTLPLVLLATFAVMWALRVPANIMSLGGIGIALGMGVDADIVALEACHRRLEGLAPGAPAATRRAALLEAATTFSPALLTSLLIAALAFLPAFAFSGETGRLLRPLVISKTIVVVVAALVTITAAPALRDRLLGGRVVAELAHPITRGLVRLYAPFVHFVLARPVSTLLAAALAVASCLPLLPRLGGEFLPRLDEGDLLFMPSTLAGVPVHDAESDLRQQDHAIAAFNEVATVFGKIGRADTATDPAPFSMAETVVRLRPRSQWPRQARRRWYSGWAPPLLRDALGLLWPEETPLTPAELIARLDRAARLPGWSSAWTAPVRARLDMMSTGVRTPIGIRIVSADPARLDRLGEAVREVVGRLPGTRDVVFERFGEEARLDWVSDHAALARFGVEPAVARATVDLLIAGGRIGEIEQGSRRLPVRISPDLQRRGRLDELGAVTVRAAGRAAVGSTSDAGVPAATATRSQPVPLALLGHPKVVSVPSVLRTERGELVAYLYVDLTDGTDLGGYVEQARGQVERALAARGLAPRAGERVDWVGQYDVLIAGRRRLAWVLAAVALSMLGLLVLQFRSLGEALIVLASVPFALVGSVWMLYLCGYALSAPVWVGLLSVIGLAAQTGVVMVVYIDEAFYRRLREGLIRDRADIVAAHAEGTIRRLRPKLMTVATMAAGLLPFLWADGAGAEILRRIAAPMVGGLLSSAFLTLEILPVLYTIWRQRQLAAAVRAGVPLETIVGRSAAWARERAR